GFRFTVMRIRPGTLNTPAPALARSALIMEPMTWNTAATSRRWMPTCWAMVLNTSPLLRGLAELFTFTALLMSSLETGRADAFFTALVAILNSLLFLLEFRQNPIGC